MIPGVLAGVVSSIYFADNNSEFITIVLFCVLITYSILSGRELRALNEKVNYLAQATSDEINNLNTTVNQEIHELALFIADKNFGPEDDDGEESDF